MINYKTRKKKARRYQKELAKMPTLSEIKFQNILDEMKVNYKSQKKIFTKKNFYIADFYIPKHKIIFEIDGGCHIDNFDYDNNRALEIYQVKQAKLIVRFPNEFIEKNKEEVKKIIINILNKQGKFYNGLISNKQKMLSKVGNEKAKEKQKRKYLKTQIKKHSYILSRLTTSEYKIISMKFGLENNNVYSDKEIIKEIKTSTDKIRQVIGKVFWLLKTDAFI